MRRIITAVGILLGVANGCPSPSSAATWPDCSRVFEKVDFTSGTISAVCGGKIAKAAAAAAAQATVQYLEQDLAKLPFSETKLGVVAAQEGKVVEKTASIVTVAKPAAAAAASKITVQDVRASSVAFEQKIAQMAKVEIRGKNAEGKIPQLMYTGKKADHHIFPQQFKKYFSERGIDIDDYTISIDQQVTHLKAVHGAGNLGEKPGRWNQHWAEWISKNPDATQKEIFQRAGEMLRSFNLQNCNIHPYKK